MSSAEVKEEMASLLEDVGLLHKWHDQTRNLSGSLVNRFHSLCQNARESHVSVYSVTLALIITHLFIFSRRHAEEALGRYSLYRRF